MYVYPQYPLTKDFIWFFLSCKDIYLYLWQCAVLSSFLSKSPSFWQSPQPVKKGDPQDLGCDLYFWSSTKKGHNLPCCVCLPVSSKAGHCCILASLQGLALHYVNIGKVIAFYTTCLFMTCGEPNMGQPISLQRLLKMDVGDP